MASVLLACIAILAIAGTVYVAYKIISSVSKMHVDPTHGQGTNDMDMFWANIVTREQAEHPGEHGTVTIPTLGITVDMSAMTNQWYQTIQTSTDLFDWYDVDVDWDQAKAMIQTNHNEPMRFFRRVVWW